MLIRKALEGSTVRLAAERATPDRIRALATIMERQREAASADDQEAFHAADEAFHAEIAEAAGHPGIWGLAQQTKVQVDRCRRLTLPIPGRMAAVIADHEAILNAIERGDGQDAARAMERHLDAILPTLAVTHNEHQDYFLGG